MRIQKWLAPFLVIVPILLLAACGSESNKPPSCPTADCKASNSSPTAAVVDNPVFPGTDWEMSSPQAESMDSAKLEGVDAYCVMHKCGGVVIVRHGRIAWERYWGGWDASTTDNSWSMAKSVTSALVGIAISEGKIKSLDDSAADYISEWKGTNKATVTLRDLITMESGLTWSMIYQPPSGDTINMIGSPDEVGYALKRTLYREPGTDWYYADGDAETFSRILKVATGMEASQYAQAKLFGPIGMNVDQWGGDQLGQTMTYCCIESSARDFARFGYLFLRNGRWGDQQVVPEQWVKESTQPSQIDNVNYGYFWWLYDFEGVPTDTFAAMGFQTKRIYVIPSLDIVAVRIGASDDSWDDGDFLKPIVDAVTGP